MEQSIMIRVDLERELKEFNKNLKKTAYDNNIRLSNECAFIIDLKKQTGNKAVFILATCFLVDDGYLRKIYDSDVIRSGDIGRYILLKIGMKEFYRGFKYKVKNKKGIKLSEVKNNSEILDYIMGTNYYVEIIKFVENIYEYNNKSTNIEFEEIFQDNEKFYFDNFIDEYIKKGIINIDMYMKKKSYNDKSGEKYLENRIKKIFNFDNTKFIHKIEMINKFYEILNKNVNIKVEKEYKRVLINYFNSIIKYYIERVVLVKIF